MPHVIIIIDQEIDDLLAALPGLRTACDAASLYTAPNRTVELMIHSTLEAVQDWLVNGSSMSCGAAQQVEEWTTTLNDLMN